jgi:DNA gyrase/topoisomerase IV subunit B
MTCVKVLPDGLAIRAGVVLLFAMAFPQVIDEGRLYMVEPPLFGFTDANGERVFKSTNREYITYLQDQFVKNNKVYYNGNKMKNNALTEFLLRNERYLEYLKNVSDKNVCSPYFTELIISNIYDLGIEKSSVKAWDKLIKKKFSPQLNAVWEDNRIIISGIKDGNYEMMELDEDLLSSRKTKKLIDIMNQNMNQIYGYSVTGENESDNLSISELLNIFSKYKAKSLHRFKGLGEMSAKELRDTCMNLNNQRSVRIVWKDVDKSIKALADWHSKKEKYRTKRRDFMLEYIPDIKEIST